MESLISSQDLMFQVSDLFLGKSYNQSQILCCEFQSNCIYLPYSVTQIASHICTQRADPLGQLKILIESIQPKIQYVSHEPETFLLVQIKINNYFDEILGSPPVTFFKICRMNLQEINVYHEHSLLLHIQVYFMLQI